MALALEERAMKDDLMLGDTPKARRRRRKLADVKTRGRLWKHSTLADLDGLVSPTELDTLFKFTLVRNPWDRMVSYYFWLAEQTFNHPAVALAKALDFEDFVTHDHTHQTHSASPARHYMTDVTGRECADLYIRLEHLAEDANPLWDHLGFELSLPRVNVSARKEDFRSYYSEKSRNAVASACAEDIKRFHYSFD